MFAALMPTVLAFPAGIQVRFVRNFHSELKFYEKNIPKFSAIP